MNRKGYLIIITAVTALMMVTAGCAEKAAKDVIRIEESASEDAIRIESAAPEDDIQIESFVPDQDAETEQTSEDSDHVREELERMLQNIALEEYFDESVLTISSAEWMQALLPRTYDVAREYLLKSENGEELLAKLAYTDGEGYFASARYTDAEGRLILTEYRFADFDRSVILTAEEPEKNADTIAEFAMGRLTILRTTLSDGQYDGPFTRWQIDAGTGDVTREEGIFEKGKEAAKKAIYVHTGTEGSQIYSLWCNRETFAYEDVNAEKAKESEGKDTTGQTKKKKTENQPTKKPANQTPSTQPAPTQPSQPDPALEKPADQTPSAQPSQPAPSQPAPSQPTPTQPTPTQPSQPTPTQPSQPTPTQPDPEPETPAPGNQDVDVEWTPDIM